MLRALTIHSTGAVEVQALVAHPARLLNTSWRNMARSLVGASVAGMLVALLLAAPASAGPSQVITLGEATVSPSVGDDQHLDHVQGPVQEQLGPGARLRPRDRRREDADDAGRRLERVVEEGRRVHRHRQGTGRLVDPAVRGPRPPVALRHHHGPGHHDHARGDPDAGPDPQAHAEAHAQADAAPTPRPRRARRRARRPGPRRARRRSPPRGPRPGRRPSRRAPSRARSPAPSRRPRPPAHPRRARRPAQRPTRASRSCSRAWAAASRAARDAGGPGGHQGPVNDGGFPTGGSPRRRLADRAAAPGHARARRHDRRRDPGDGVRRVRQAPPGRGAHRLGRGARRGSRGRRWLRAGRRGRGPDQGRGCGRRVGDPGSGGRSSRATSTPTCRAGAGRRSWRRARPTRPRFVPPSAKLDVRRHGRRRRQRDRSAAGSATAW